MNKRRDPISSEHPTDERSRTRIRKRTRRDAAPRVDALEGRALPATTFVGPLSFANPAPAVSSLNFPNVPGPSTDSIDSTNSGGGTNDSAGSSGGFALHGNLNLNLNLNALAGVSTSATKFAAVFDPRTNQLSESIVAERRLNLIVVRSATGTVLQRLDASFGLNGPTALTVADLNGTGEQDLIVANGGGNNVLIFRPRRFGLGFGSEMNGGKGIPVGLRPDGLAVADLNGDHVPDLVVADGGSNQVSLFYGRPGPSGWSYVTGPLLDVGVAPLATAVGNVNGNGNGVTSPEILVGNVGSKSITILKQGSDGTFDFPDSSTIDIGHAPGSIVIGPFVPGTGTDLAAIDPRSDNVSMVMNLADPGQPITFSSGGRAPVGLIAAPSFDNGGLDLIVANSGSNNLALFQSGLFAGQQARILTSLYDTAGFLSQPAGLALAPISNHSTDLVVFSATGNQSITIKLPLGIPADGNSAIPYAPFTLLVLEPSPLLTSLSTATVEPNVLLLPLDNANIEVIATLTSLALSPTSTELGSTLFGPASQPPAQPSVGSRDVSTRSFERIPLAGFPNALNRDGVAAPWTRFAMGLDQFLETERLAPAVFDQNLVDDAIVAVDRPPNPTDPNALDADQPLGLPIGTDFPGDDRLKAPIELAPNARLAAPLLEPPRSGESLADGVAPLLFAGVFVSNRFLRRRRSRAGRLFRNRSQG